jgi:hypothetical protein
VALANVLASSQAVEMGIYVVRAFVQIRQASNLHADLAKRLAKLEEQTDRLEMSHDSFSRNTRNQLKQVFDTLRELMTPPELHKRPIGFITPEDNSKPKASKATGGRLGARCTRFDTAKRHRGSEDQAPSLIETLHLNDLSC